MNLLRPSVLHLHTDDSNPDFRSVKNKRLHDGTYEQFWVFLSRIFTKNQPWKKYFHLRFPLFIT